MSKCDVYFILFFSLAPPKLDASLKKDSMPVLLQSTLQLNCTESGYPEPKVKWTNNGIQVGNNNTLVITNVTFKDAGQYGCVAMNIVGNVSGKIWIDIIGKLSKSHGTQKKVCNRWDI